MPIVDRHVIVTDVQNIIETSQRWAYHAVNTILSQRNIIGDHSDNVKAVVESTLEAIDRHEEEVNCL